MTKLKQIICATLLCFGSCSSEDRYYNGDPAVIITENVDKPIQILLSYAGKPSSKNTVYLSLQETVSLRDRLNDVIEYLITFKKLKINDD